MAARKGIALGDILEASAAGAVTPTMSDKIVTMLAALKPEALRLEFRLSHAADWTAPGLLDTYAQQINRIKAALAPEDVLIIGEITYQSVPQSGQAAWNAQFTEPRPGPSPSMNAYIVRYFQSIEAILTTRLADGTQITDLVDHWEIWNEPNTWTDNQKDKKGNWGASGWHQELGDPATFDPQNLTAQQQQFLDANPTFPLNRDTPGGTYIYPSLYATLLTGSAALIHEIQPFATVVAGGIFGFDGHPGLDYVEKTFSHLQTVPVWLDGFAQHLYFSLQGAGGVQAQLQHNQQDCLNKLSAFLTSKGRGLPLYVTEAGFASQAAQAGKTVDNSRPAADCATLFAACAATQALDSLYWFTLQDSSNISLGLIDSTGNWKPQMFAAFTAPL